MAGLRAIAAASERRADRRLERYRLKQQAKIAVAEASGRARNNDESYRRELVKIIAAHDRTDARWLDYEVDIAKLLDFPLMTDMRAPLTIAFHKAKRHADLLRPERPDDLVGDRDAQLEYRNAVHEYISAFEIAEAEAHPPTPQRLLRRRTATAGPRPAPAGPGARRVGHA